MSTGRYPELVQSEPAPPSDHRRDNPGPAPSADTQTTVTTGTAGRGG